MTDPLWAIASERMPMHALLLMMINDLFVLISGWQGLASGEQTWHNITV
jgi:hypothetical protein